MADGTYNDTVSFTNTTNGTGSTTRTVTLTISARPGALAVTPAGDFASSGVTGGPFTPASQAYTLENSGGTSIDWTAAKTQTWTTLSAVSGTLAAGATATVTVSINAAADTLAAGTYNDTVSFTNTTDGAGSTTRAVTLTVSSPAGTLAVTPAGDFASSGVTGGPFTPPNQGYTLENTGSTSISWTASKTQPWTTLSAVSGTLTPGATAAVTVSINAAANSLAAGTHNDTVSFTNTTNGSGNTTRAVTLTVSSPAGALAVTPAGGLSRPRVSVGGPFTPSSLAYTPAEHGRDVDRLDGRENADLDDACRRSPGRWPPGRPPRSPSRSTPRPTPSRPAPTPTPSSSPTRPTERATRPGRSPSTSAPVPSSPSLRPDGTSTFAAGTTTFDVSNAGGGTLNWTAAVVAGGRWLTIASGASGTGDGTITVAFADNRTSSERVGIVRVTAAGAAGSPKDVTVTQASGTFSLILGAARLTESAWIISRQYGRLTVTVANPAAITIDRYIIYRKVGDGAFEVLQEIAGSSVDGSVLDLQRHVPGARNGLYLSDRRPERPGRHDRHVKRCHDLSVRRRGQR